MQWPEGFDALVLDLDGVVTRTAAQHARAWKQLFDDFLEQREPSEGETQQPFSIERDYPRYVDGKPRYDGVRSFLESRGIQLPEGQAEDPPGQQTVCGLGNRKNEIFQKLIQRDGVEVFSDAVEFVRGWRREGRKTAIVSSSKNCQRVLRAAELEDLFDVRVDGVTADELQLHGKPDPDIFLEAARRLDVPPTRAIVVEDAIAGVEAGRAGGFGLVVGMAREGEGDALRRHGADLSIREFTQLRVPPSALERLGEIRQTLGEKTPALFLDYDGTLTPIVERPEDARLSSEMRETLRQVARRHPLAIVSGRDRPDVQQLVDLDELIYAGSHGFDIAGPGGMRMEQEDGKACLPELDQAERELNESLSHIEGTQVERKRFAIAVHYRRAPEEQVPVIERRVEQVRRRHERLRKRGGKKIFELQPDIPWDKGRAVLWLLDALDLDRPDVLPFYIGDDLTDEDAFAALAERGIGILVSQQRRYTGAPYWLREPADVRRFLGALTGGSSPDDATGQNDNSSDE